MTYPTVRVYVDLVAGAFDHASTWTEITDWAKPIRARHGRSSLLDDFQPGSGVVVLDNNDGRFDPANTAGPYYPNLTPRRRVKVEATIGDSAYSDPFGDTTISTTLWTVVGSGGVAETGGNLVLTSSTSATTRGVQANTVTPFYDLLARASGVVMSATPWPASAVFYPIYLRMDAADTEAAWFEITGGFISAAWKKSGATHVEWTAAHSNATHAYLRVRRYGHITLWETSTDGSTWTERHQEQVAWQEADTCVLRVVVTTTSGEATTDTMSISDLTVAYSAVHPIAYGWVKGWPQDQRHRKMTDVELEWSDALTLLARTNLPSSVYDYVVKSMVDLWAWYRLNDQLPILEDSSGRGSHGLWGTIEERQSPYSGLEFRPLPESVLKAGEAASVVPSTGRPGKSFARLQAEIDQPLGGATDTPRAPVAVGGPNTMQTAVWPFSVELWVQFRQAFNLNITNGPASTTPIPQPLITWGENPYGGTSNRWRLYMGQDGNLYFVATNVTGSGSVNIIGTGGLLADGQPHHIVLKYDGATVRTYVDTVLQGLTTPGAGNPLPADVAVIGGAHNYSGTVLEEMHLQSTLGDVVFYNDNLLFAEIEALYYAGKYGSLTTDTRLTTGQVIGQALTMAGWAEDTAIDSGGHYVRPSIPDGAPALGYIREASRSERGGFWQTPSGVLTFVTSAWPATLGRSSGAHWRLSDDGTSELGYSSPIVVDYDDDTLVNEAEVSWADGEQSAEDAASIAAYGRLRESVNTILDTPEDAKQLAEWMTSVYGQPRPLLGRSLRVEPVTTLDFVFCCSVEVLTRLQITRTTTDGRTVTSDWWVQAVDHQIEPGRGAWVTSLTLEPADHPGAVFTLDGSPAYVGSLLNSTDVLAF